MLKKKKKKKLTAADTQLQKYSNMRMSKHRSLMKGANHLRKTDCVRFLVLQTLLELQRVSSFSVS